MTKKPRLRIKRIYEEPSAEDGIRILVDRLWPRGIKKDAAKLDEWAKEIAPSDALRRWYGHDTNRWREFQRRYTAELRKNDDVCRKIVQRAKKETVTLLYGARDPEHNQATVLKEYLEHFDQKGERA